jgi:hypothetical protein
MQFIEQSFPFIITDVKKHNKIKPLILKDIESIGKHSLIEDDQKISNSDWYLPSNIERTYFSHITDTIFELRNNIVKQFNYSTPSTNLQFWFQQYEKGDHHGWHVHFGCMFSNVYYVDLPEGASKTSLKVLDKEIEVDVKEGQILTFPSCFLHTSKPNKSEKVKTVIAVNF